MFKLYSADHVNCKHTFVMCFLGLIKIDLISKQRPMGSCQKARCAVSSVCVPRLSSTLCNRWLTQYPILMKYPIVPTVYMHSISKRTSDVKQKPQHELPFLNYLSYIYREHSSPIMVHGSCEAAQPACSPSRPCHKSSQQLPAPNLLPGVSERWSG